MLDAIGLPDPIFDNNTFILKMTIVSASFESETTENASIHDKTALIGILKILERQGYIKAITGKSKG